MGMAVLLILMFIGVFDWWVANGVFFDFSLDPANPAPPTPAHGCDSAVVAANGVSHSHTNAFNCSHNTRRRFLGRAHIGTMPSVKLNHTDAPLPSPLALQK